MTFFKQTEIRIAVVGNPNSGKSTLINAIAGSKLRVGNWTGVTVEKREALLHKDRYKIRWMDFPGIYSLSTFSEEEKITQHYLLNEKPDIILNVIDTTNLERSLYLTLQLLELKIPMILALNMQDEAQKMGRNVNINKLSKMLGVTCIATTSTKKVGIKDLLEAVILVKERGYSPISINYGTDSDHYAKAIELAKEVMMKCPMTRVYLSEKIDVVLLHPFFGLPIFFLLMWFVFKLTFDLSMPYVRWLNNLITDYLTNWLSVFLMKIHVSSWLIRLMSEGVLGGTGAVLAFVPVIFMMMFLITCLEGSGYMARAAFIMDKSMQVLGLHGKSFIPLMIAFGCNVPAIYATRTLESRRERLHTALLVPLMSCSAKLPVYALFVGIFFPAHASIVLWSLYMLGIVLAVIVGKMLQIFLFSKDPPMFIMELPPYRIPSFSHLISHAWERTRHFIIKAGTYILAISVVVWFLFNFPVDIHDKKESYLGMVGQFISPILHPIGFGNWQATASLLVGIAAKEAIVGSMGEIYQTHIYAETKNTFSSINISDDLVQMMRRFVDATRDAILQVGRLSILNSLDTTQHALSTSLQRELRLRFTPLSAYSFIVFVLIYVPCVATIIAFLQEFRSAGWFFVALAYSFPLAWFVSYIVFQGGKLLGLG